MGDCDNGVWLAATVLVLLLLLYRWPRDDESGGVVEGFAGVHAAPCRRPPGNTRRRPHEMPDAALSTSVR